ncbi:MAG: DUF3368 domain-containing protein [Planctomycetes bacterium]|nr:DUF3368 domain-containing protein [Planctomycetota bacterium]
MRPIVSDAGPLITFARAGELPLLRQVVGRLLVPQAVHDELVLRGSGRPPAADVQSGEWIDLLKRVDNALLNDLPASLGSGEREAIALCRALGAFLLADDPAARREARGRGVSLISSLDILDDAKTRHMVAEVKPNLDRLVRTGFRLKRTLYDAKLRAAGE